MQTAVNPPEENFWHEVILIPFLEDGWLITANGNSNNMRIYENLKSLQVHLIVIL